MKFLLYVISTLVTLSIKLHAQSNQSIYKIPRELLAGEGLDKIEQEDSTRIVYQKRVYDGVDIRVYMVAIGTGITNEFNGFPIEEFILWINGKAIVEPVGKESFEIQSGDYFIQAKGFNGKWNFIDNGGLHLELALVAKNRPDSTFKSPMNHAMILDRDLISGVSKPEKGKVYEGPELSVKLLYETAQILSTTQERMIHILSGVLTLVDNEGLKHQFFPGDFFVVPNGFKGKWRSNSLQDLRMIEVYKTRLD